MDDFVEFGEELFLYAEEGVTVFRDWDGDGMIDGCEVITPEGEVVSFEPPAGWSADSSRSMRDGLEYGWGWNPTPRTPPEIGDSGMSHSHIPAAWRGEGKGKETLEN